MLHSVQYTCPAVLLPVIEGAFAAHNYIVKTAPNTQRRGVDVVVLHQDATIVLLTQRPHDPVGEIAIWGPDKRAAVSLLESLPLELHRQLPFQSRTAQQPLNRTNSPAMT